MRQLLLLLFYITALSCFGQFAKPVTLRATVNMNIPIAGLGTNNFGAGLGLDASFFSRNKLQAIVEASADRFIGDKLLVVNIVTGKEAKNAAVYSIKAGPQYFLNQNFALAVTYGPTSYVVREFTYTMTGGFKLSITGFLGEQKRFVTNAFLVNIPNEQQSLRYFGLAAGYRF